MFGCPRAWAGARLRAIPNDLIEHSVDPVRVLANGEAVQGEAGRAGRDTLSNTDR
jgi:hypothetical protein